MNDRIRELLAQIAQLEDELRGHMQTQGQEVAYKLHGKRVEFEQSVRETHRRLQTSFVYWMFKDRPWNLLTGPVIYSMILPLVLLDVCVSLYQALCFPVYRVAKVRRADFFVYDRRQLAYLNFIERFHCTYCSYATGLLAYATEIVARTEQYFCPIKHATSVAGVHARYARFLAFGEPADYAGRLEAFRRALDGQADDEPPA